MSKDWPGNSGSVFKTLGASSHSTHERQQHDYYATEEKAVVKLLEVMGDKLSNNIWECACGEGHISNVIKRHLPETNVRNSDLIDRGINAEVLDFLTTERKYVGDIVTNPPYKYASEFVEKALELVDDGRYVCMFLKVTFLEGQKRKLLFDKYPPKVVYVSSERLKCAINGDFASVGSSATAYAWFVWEKGFIGDPVIKWI
jgi:hypothetical protein